MATLRGLHSFFPMLAPLLAKSCRLRRNRSLGLLSTDGLDIVGMRGAQARALDECSVAVYHRRGDVYERKPRVITPQHVQEF